jgi:hypothetical protein
MRARAFLPGLALLAAALPISAGASATSADLVLSPAQGAPGSHFTATLTFTEAPCSAFTVQFFWDAPTPALSLGSAAATGSGPTCEASIDAVVPSTDAVPSHSYPVGATAGTEQVNAGNSSTVVWSSKDSGTAPFDVTSPPSQSSHGSGPTPSAPGHSTTTGSTSTSTGGPSGTAGQPVGTGGSSTSAAPPDAGPSPDAGALGSPPSTDGTNAPLLTLQQPHAPPTGGIGGAILAATVAFLAVLITGSWAHRTGRLRTLLRR